MPQNDPRWACFIGYLKVSLYGFRASKRDSDETCSTANRARRPAFSNARELRALGLLMWDPFRQNRNGPAPLHARDLQRQLDRKPSLPVQLARAADLPLHHCAAASRMLSCSYGTCWPTVGGPGLTSFPVGSKRLDTQVVVKGGGDAQEGEHVHSPFSTGKQQLVRAKSETRKCKLELCMYAIGVLIRLITG